MRAVSNTSPLSNLASIDRLLLLRAQFSEIFIPQAVEQELAAHPSPAARARIQAAIQEKWIKPAVADDSHLLKLLLQQLHRGEAEAIALAAQIKADTVVIDEQEGRELASQAALSVIGVLGILLRAKRIGQLPAIKPEINALRVKARFYIAASLEAKILAAAGE
jgi:uncharacterized protein